MKAACSEKIKYYDFTSLYPYINKYCEYPVGHPEIITDNFTDFSHYFGVAKIKILPPDFLYHPVLPLRSGGKLKFPLCRTCSLNENKEKCICSMNERCLIGTWCTPEIKKALEKGYKIVKIYEIYHFKNTSTYDKATQKGGIFSEYVDTFVKIKQEASGWPEDVDVTQDSNKRKYIENYKKFEGIKLDENKIKFNSGLRSVSKLLLNSLWGKYGQNAHLTQTKYFTEDSLESFITFFLDETIEIKKFVIAIDGVLMVEYQAKQGFIKENKKTNIFIATFTTMHARLKLYDVLDKLGERVLYMDTDSVIFISYPDSDDPPIGNYLGELTSEISALDGGYIIEFVSCGPKNYAYTTKSGKQVCKIRGFSLNFKNVSILNFDALCDMVINDSDQKRVLFNENKIVRDKGENIIYNRPEEKVYRMVYTKRVILENYDTVPYGYK